MYGGQSLAVLGWRFEIDWCFPPVIQCRSAIKWMDEIYINGDKEAHLPRHHVPVYKDSRSRRANRELSKVLERLNTTKARLPFLL